MSCFAIKESVPARNAALSLCPIIYHKKIINIPRQSRGFFICGQSPRMPATPHVALVRPDTCMGSVTCYPLTGDHSHLLSCLIFIQLVFDVFSYLVCIFSYRIYIIATTPEFSVSVLQLQCWELFVDHQTTLPFQVPHETGYRYLWWYLYKHVHMIGTDFCFINLNSLPFTKLPKYLSNLHLLFSEEDLSSILGCKDYVVFAIPFRMR